MQNTVFISCRFYVDNVPIREFKRTAAMGKDFPSKPMSVYVTIWDGSEWATNGGKYKVNYKYAPYVAEFKDLVLHGCAVDPIQLTKCEYASSRSLPTGITLSQRLKMENFRRKHLTYSYCYDHTRYEVPPPECTAVPGESERLKAFDPVTFGVHGHRHHHGKRRALSEALPM